jgi:aspartate carbamoyltransferase catalytic subunit
VAIVGDVLHSRVARSNVLLLSTLGAKVTLVGPPTLLPVDVAAKVPARSTHNASRQLWLGASDATPRPGAAGDPAPSTALVPDIDVSYDLDAVLPDADVVMLLRVQRERMADSFFPSAREYARRYGLDMARMRRLPEHALVMHPGPMNRGMEIAPEVADSARSTIVEQVANGVSVRMAVLYLLLGGKN